MGDLDDEQALIDLLTPFLRAKKSRAMVFFDRAATGHSGQRNFGLVKAVFVPAGTTADTAIAEYIQQLGASARNHSLVSSDRMVQAAGRAHHLTILTSQSFSEQLELLSNQLPQPTTQDSGLSEREVKEWENFFNQYGSQPPDGLNP